MIRLYIACVGAVVATGVVFSTVYPAARLGVAWWTVMATIVMTSLVVALHADPCEPAVPTWDEAEDDGGWSPGDDGPAAPEPPPGGRSVAVEALGAVDWNAEVDAIWARVGDRVGVA